MIIKERFKDRVFIITGAAGGIGYEAAKRAAREGARLILADRKEELSRKAELELKKITSDIEFMVMDLKLEENCRKLVDTAWEKYGRIDVLINNAGITGTPAPVHQMSTEMFTEVIESNLYSAFFCSHFAVEYMIKQGGNASVINVSSVAGLVGFPGHSAYVTSKHAMCGLTKNMALDYAKYNIRVNAVNPGTTETPMYYEALNYLKLHKEDTPKQNGKNKICPPKLVSAQARAARPEEVSDVILFLISDEASNITGTTIPVDGGFVCY